MLQFPSYLQLAINKVEDQKECTTSSVMFAQRGARVHQLQLASGASV